MEKLFPDKKRLTILKNLGKRLHYRFRDIALLATALTHRSFVNENSRLSISDNERLEFLGDAVLGLSASVLITKKYPDLSEGALSKIRAGLVNEKILAGLSLNLKIGECLLLGHGEEKSGGRNKSSLLANALEAVFAAIYLDSNFKKADSVIKSLIEPVLQDDALRHQCFDYKTALQELSQKRFKTTPVYATSSSSGPEHAVTLQVELTIPGIITQTGAGKNKKEAENKAAQKAWEILHIE